MDTKSKNYKNSYALKTTAFLLAVVLAFSSAYFAIKAINNIYSYGSSIVLKPKDEADVTTSSAFVSQLMDDLQSAYFASGIMGWETYKNQRYSSYDNELQNAKSSLKAFKEKSMSEAVRRYYDRSSYESQYGSAANDYETQDNAQTTANSGGSAQDLVGIENFDADYYYSVTTTLSLSSGSEITLTTQMTDKDLEDTVKAAYDSGMIRNKREYETKVNTEQKNIESLKNLRFYIIDPKTGFTYGNMGNIDEKTASEQIKKYGWFLGYTVSDGLKSSSDQVTSGTLYAYNEASNNYYYINTQKIRVSADSLSLNSVLENCFSNNGYNVYISLDTSYEQADKYAELQDAFVNSGSQTYNSAMASLICLLLVIFISFYLMFVTGHVNGAQGIKLSFLDKIPTDLHLLASGGLAAACVAGIITIAYSYASYNGVMVSSAERIAMFASMSALAAAAWAVVIEWLMSTAKYYKIKRNWIYSTFTFWAFKQIVRFFKFIFRKIKRFFKLFAVKLDSISKKIIWYSAGYVAGNMILSAFTMSSLYSQNNGLGFTFFLITVAYNLIVFSIIWKFIIALDKIISESGNTKNGGPPKNLSVEKMPGLLKTLAGNLYYTQEEMSKAVDEAVRGEKMKTELITNVSHDLKTPLTSIISYVDLLKKCDIDDISAQKYITVLDEKSARLKRLIEDLVEASKASSGAVAFNKMNVNFYELAVQAIGEMEDVFEEKDLEIVLNESKDNPVIFADSQKTWRVIDNLLSNVKKYALGGTRVYVDILSENGYGVFMIKNTSRDALNIDPQELTNRFVRGDESRTLEGSGLGLSIAKDLCDLQGGKLELFIDGDLFKAVVKMPLAENIDIKAEIADNSEAEYDGKTGENAAK